MYSTGSYNYGAAAQASAAAQTNSSVGFDTSSNDPELVKARVFVGNLNTTTISRDELIQLFRVYGTLTGVTLFKGFSFVQYAKEADAVLAVQALNGYNWNGSVLDVKLASQNRPGASSVTATPASAGMKSGFGYGQKAAYDYGHAAGYGGGGAYGGGGYGGGYGAYAGGAYGAYGGAGGGGGYGGYGGRGGGGGGGYFAGQKRSYPYGGGGGGTNFSTPTSGAGGVNAEKVNAENKKFATSVATHPDIVDHHNASDFLVCGECRFVSSSIMAFIEHRKEPCTFFKAETEPAGRLQCFNCTDAPFSNCWKLLQHLTTMHKLTLYKAAGEEETVDDTSPADGGENGSGTGEVAHAGEQ